MWSLSCLADHKCSLTTNVNLTPNWEHGEYKIKFNNINKDIDINFLLLPESTENVKKIMR